MKKSSIIIKIFLILTIISAGMSGACGSGEAGSVKFDIGGEYIFAADFSQGLAAVKQGEKYVYIDKNGNKVFETNAYVVGNFHEDRAWFLNADGKGGYFDKQGNTVFEMSGMTSSTMRDYHSSLAVVNIVQGYGVDCFVIDLSGEKAEEFKEYKNTGEYGDFNEGIARYSGENNKYGYIKSDGTLITESCFNEAGDFSCGMALVDDGEKYVIDITGEKVFVIDEKFTDCQGFNDDVMRVKEDGKWSFIDKSGVKIFEKQFDTATDFSNGYAAVSNDGKFCVIDKSGDILFEAPEGTLEMSAYAEGFFAFRTQQGWGYLKADGTVAVKPYFDYAGQCSEGLAACRKSDKWGYIKLSDL